MAKRVTPQLAEEIRVRRGIGKDTKLKRLRVKRGLSQNDLANISGVSLRTLQKFENDPSRIDSTKLLTHCKLCEALNCKIGDIVENEELIERFNKIK